jgi:mRNA-degrading endonuclease toxin of MazEF toxin-antitoxin module
MCDNLVSPQKSDVTNFVGTLPAAKLAELNRALRMGLDPHNP